MNIGCDSGSIVLYVGLITNFVMIPSPFTHYKKNAVQAVANHPPIDEWPTCGILIWVGGRRPGYGLDPPPIIGRGWVPVEQIEVLTDLGIPM